MINSKNEILINEPAKQIQRREFYPVEDFPKLKVIEENYSIILEELNKLLLSEKGSTLFSPWVEKTLYETSDPEGWQVLPLIMNGSKIKKYTENFPQLINILDKINGIVTVLISKLIPDAWISPHSGYENYSDKIFRYHMGLIVPEGDLGFKVGSSVKYWENGKGFIFDDSLVHTAWNFSKQDRYILIVDFIRNDNESMGSLKDLILTEEAKFFFDYYNKDNITESNQLFQS